MIRSTMRTWLERRTDGAWTDSQMNDVLNQACLTVAQFVTSADPDYLIRIRRQNLEASVAYYPRPVDGRHVDSVWLKDSASASYKPLRKVTRLFILNRYRYSGVSNGGETVWARFGRYIQIDPAPSASLADGLQIVEAFNPTMSEDGSEPPLPLDLHQAVMNRAHRLLLPETADFLQLADALDKEYASMLSDWKTGYFETAEPATIDIDDPGYEAEG